MPNGARPSPDAHDAKVTSSRLTVSARRFTPSVLSVAASPARTAAACGRQRCIRSSAPQSSTTSIRRPGSPMSSTASPKRPRTGSSNSSPGTGWTAGGTIRLHRPRRPHGAPRSAARRRQNQPRIPCGLRWMLTHMLLTGDTNWPEGCRAGSRSAFILLLKMENRGHRDPAEGREAPRDRIR